jgi:hypothetical protein
VNVISAALVVGLFAPSLIGQTSITTTIGETTATITEPGVTDIPELLHVSDEVALVKIVSGDTEHYKVAVYKARVIQSFKGAVRDETLYFGPYVGLKLGWEYIVFLRATTEPLQPLAATAASYGPVPYLRIFNEGYTVLETSSQCVFRGENASERCDDAVRVCTDYVKTPKSLVVAPPLEEDTPFGCRWARRKEFIAFLEGLAKAKHQGGQDRHSE